MRGSHRLESREQKPALDPAGETRAKVCPVQTGASGEALQGHQSGKGQTMNVAIVIAVVVALQAVGLLSAVALGAMLEQRRERALNEFLRTKGGAS